MITEIVVGLFVILISYLVIEGFGNIIILTFDLSEDSPPLTIGIFFLITALVLLTICYYLGKLIISLF